MKERNLAEAKKLLKPHREQIDKIDRQILKLLGERFGVVRKVAKIKIKHDIPAFIGDRVDEVRNNAVRNGVKYGIDADFIKTLYTTIIYQSCATEDLLKLAEKKKTKKKK
jgi:chorismate mutase-like protein